LSRKIQKIFQLYCTAHTFLTNTVLPTVIFQNLYGYVNRSTKIFFFAFTFTNFTKIEVMSFNNLFHCLKTFPIPFFDYSLTFLQSSVFKMVTYRSKLKIYKISNYRESSQKSKLKMRERLWQAKIWTL
jgi:hypothetical protein